MTRSLLHFNIDSCRPGIEYTAVAAYDGKLPGSILSAYCLGAAALSFEFREFRTTNISQLVLPVNGRVFEALFRNPSLSEQGVVLHKHDQVVVRVVNTTSSPKRFEMFVEVEMDTGDIEGAFTEVFHGDRSYLADATNAVAVTVRDGDLLLDHYQPDADGEWVNENAEGMFAPAKLALAAIDRAGENATANALRERLELEKTRPARFIDATKTTVEIHFEQPHGADTIVERYSATSAHVDDDGKVTITVSQ